MLVRRADDPDFVKVLDFGIARLHWGEQSMATAAGLIFGTARYISPEGAQGEQVGPPGDVYCDRDDALPDALRARRRSTPTRPSRCSSSRSTTRLRRSRASSAPRTCPSRSPRSIMKNLSKRPGDRAEDARAFGRALLEAAVTSGLERAGHPRAPVAARRDPRRGPERGADGVDAAHAAARARSDDRVAHRCRHGLRDAVAVGRGGGGVEPCAGPDGDLRPVVAASRNGHDEMGGSAPLRDQAPAAGVQDGPRRRGDDGRPAEGPAADRRARAHPVRLPRPQRVSQIDTTPPLGRISRRPAPTSKPPSSVEATLAGEESPARAAAPRAPLWRGALLGVACVLAGALGMVAIAWKVGIIGAPPRASIGPLPETPVTRAHSDPPPEFRAPEPPPALPPLDLSVPPRAKAMATGASPARPAAPTGSAAPAGGGRVVVDASSARPGIGQPVDFVAHLPSSARSAKVDGAQFLIAGPGIAAGTALPASDDGSGVYRTTFTFLEDGHFDVAFTARADGAPLRGGRAVVVGEPSATPPAPAAEAPTPAPANANSNAAPGARWL